MTPKAITRRSFLKITAVSAAGLAAAYGLSHFRFGNANTVSESRFLLGTVITLTVVAPNERDGRLAIANTFGEIERLSRIFSRFDPQSQAFRLNAEGQLREPAAELVSVLRQARSWSELTGGAFDITVMPVLDLYQRAQDAGNALPSVTDVQRTLALVDYRQVIADETRVTFGCPGMNITLDGIAKGFVIDAAVGVLKSADYSDVLVEAGGDLSASGRREDAGLWHIGVRAPGQPGAVTACFMLSNCAAATSGDYEQAFTADRRLNHIIDPRTGLSPLELSSVTILAPRAVEADALATAVTILGSEAGLKLVKSLPGFEAYLITKAGQTIWTAGFPV